MIALRFEILPDVLLGGEYGVRPTEYSKGSRMASFFPLFPLVTLAFWFVPLHRRDVHFGVAFRSCCDLHRCCCI